MNALRNKYKSYEEGLEAWLEANKAIYSEPCLGPWTEEDVQRETEAFKEMWDDPNLTELPSL